MNVHCHQIEARIQQYLDRQLDDAQQQALLLHLELCESCRAGYQPLLEAIRDVEHAPPPPLPPGLLDRVLLQMPVPGPSADSAELAAPPRPAFRRIVLWCSGMAAAAAALLMATWWPGITPGPAGRLGGTPPQVVQVDPNAVMWLAAGVGTAPIHGRTALAMAAGQAALWSTRPHEHEPARIVVCMADFQPQADEVLPMPHVPDAIQFLANQAALQSGL